MKKIIIVFTVLFISQISFAQGVITGTLMDGEFNDVLAFANVIVKDSSTGVTSDFDGKYTLELKEGTYTIAYSFLGYETKEITGVEVKNNQTKVIDVTLNPTSASLDQVVVSVSSRKNTVASVLAVQKNSVSLMDGLSLETIKNTGASSVATAVKSVPGVSIQGGKYVYVRGLGDRYTKSILNGIDVPGLDPDRNTLQLDIFPTAIIENIMVSKSASADQPADFTGGVVNIVTKDIPSKKMVDFSLGLGYNPDFHFNKNNLTSTGSPTDFLGFDDGYRSNPINAQQNVPLPQESPNTLITLTQRFEKDMAVSRERSFLDFSFSGSAGNKFTVGDSKLGYFASVSYKNNSSYFDQYIDGQVFRKNPDATIFDLRTDRSQTGELSKNNVLLSGLLATTLKTEKSKYKLSLLHVQNGVATNSIFRQANLLISSNEIIKNNSLYTQRSTTNLLLYGKHNLGTEGDWLVEWKVAPTLAKIQDKDFKISPFKVIENSETGEETFSIEPSESGLPARIFRDLEEINVAGKLDIQKKHQLFKNGAKLKTGLAYTYKTRDFIVDNFAIAFNNLPNGFANGDPNQILADSNIFNTNTNSGTFIRRDSGASDNYTSYSALYGGYLSEDFKLANWLNVNAGVRVEKYDVFYTGQRQDGTKLVDAQIIDKLDFFPSVNLIFDLNENQSQKIRTSYSRTTARPSFKEASLAEIFDPINSTFFIGNINLQPTYVQNLDLRYEAYGEKGDFFALSGFYKSFTDPIELTFIRVALGQFTPQNLGDATVYGGELEIRKNLGFITGWEHFNFNANFSLIESEQTYSADEKQSRLDNLREGETLPSTRNLQGQSPYLLNVGISYDNIDTGWKGGFYFNTQGKTLQIVGSGNIPDVYTLPFDNLNFNISKAFGKNKRSKISLKFENLLDDDLESVYQSYQTEDEVYSKWSPGQRMNLKYSFTF